jgi:hypothetical protein
MAREGKKGQAMSTVTQEYEAMDAYSRAITTAAERAGPAVGSAGASQAKGSVQE